MTNIALPGAVRSNVLSLQRTNEQASKIQERLATGLKVNSALDNPNAFFTSKTLQGRANDLGTLLEDIGQSIQTIKAADKGLTSIEQLLQNAKAKANQAIQTSNRSERADYAKEYNQLLRQIEGIAEDSGYKGKNLLSDPNTNNLTVYFNEDTTNSLTVRAESYTSAQNAFSLSTLEEAAEATTVLTDAAFASSTTVLAGSASFTVGEVYTLTSADAGAPAATDLSTNPSGNSVTLTITEDTTAQDFVNFINSFGGTTATFGTGANTIDVEAFEDFSITRTTGTGGTPFVQAATTNVKESGFNSDTDIQSILTTINSALSDVRARASALGTSLSIIETRENFTEDIVNTLEEGSDKLVLADINEESANLLTLQTRSSLGTTALQLSAQADQSVLRLF